MVDESQEKAAKSVVSYFEKIINGYLANDIKSLLNDELDKKVQGGCTAPLAMTVFSAMNQLGYLTNKKETKEIVDEGETATETCIKSFCNDWMSKIDKTYKKSTLQEMFVNLFRHGIAHQFLSIYSTGITRNPRQTPLIDIHKDESGREFYVLQIKMLAINFLKALELLQGKIERAIENDHNFILRFYDRFVAQRQKYLKKNANLLSKVERNFQRPECDRFTTSTTTSGIEMETTQTIDRSFELPD